MKKKTKVNKKKLDSLLLVLLLTAVLMVMSTYAWFTANRTVEIGSIDVHVKTASGLMISADGKEWGPEVTVSQIKNAKLTGYDGAKNQIPDDIAPVSTDLELDGEYLKMFYGTIEQDSTRGSDTFGKYFLTATKEEDKDGVSGHYVAFDVFIKSGSNEENLYLSGDIVEMVKNSDGTYSRAETERGIANAARVALVRGNRTTNVDSQTAVTGLTIRGGKVMMWEPNYDYHTEKSSINAHDMYGVEIGKDGSNDYIEYAGINKVITDGVLITDAKEGHDAFTKVNYTWATKKDSSTSLTIPNDDGGYAISEGATKYRIYMWVEGQDYDCENNASGSYLQFDLNFSLDSGENMVIPVNSRQE